MKIHLSIAAPPEPATQFEHPGPAIHIGRDPDCEVVFQGEAGSGASRRHARIELSEGGATLTDLGSSNGTLLNGQMLDGPAALHVGDRIQLGFTGPTLTVLKLDLSASKPVRMSGPVVIGSAAAVAVAAAIVIAVIALRKPNTPEYAVAPSTEPPVAVVLPDKGGSPVVLPVPDTGRAAPPVRPDQEKPTKELPDLAVKEVGTYVALDNWVSVLLRRQGEDQPWGVLRPESRVATAQTLVSLPGYRSLIVLEGGTHLTLWGNLPEFSPFPPVLESVVMLHVPAAGTDLEFTLDRGRVVVANLKSPAGPARVRLRFLRETWDLELPDDKSEVALELWGMPDAEAGERSRAAPPTCLGLFAKGHVRVKTPREDLDLADRSRLSWVNQEAGQLNRAALTALPEWWTKRPDPKLPEVAKAMRSLLDWRDRLTGPGGGPEQKKKPQLDEREPLVTRIKNQVADVDVADPDDQDLGVFFLAALDEVEPLVGFVGAEDERKSSLRGCALYGLQAWLCRGSQHAAELARILMRRGYSESEAALIVRLLHPYAEEAIRLRKTYEELVGFLDHKNPLVRLLAWWHFNHLGDAGLLPAEAKLIEYEPTWDAEKRQPAVEKWKKLVADGKVPMGQR